MYIVPYRNEITLFIFSSFFFDFVIFAGGKAMLRRSVII